MQLHEALTHDGFLCSPTTFKLHGIYQIKVNRWYLGTTPFGFCKQDILSNDWRVYVTSHAERLELAVIQADRAIGAERVKLMAHLLELLSESCFLE